MLIGVDQTLNMIGFRKALKKFEKIAKVSIVVDSQLMFDRWFQFALQIPAQQAYTVEKIEPNTFASSVTVQGLLKEIEELYATHFSKRHAHFRPLTICVRTLYHSSRR